MIYIYALVCPVTGRTRYIGKCKNIQHRLTSHISNATAGRTNHHCARWIMTLLNRGLKPTIRVLITLPANANWQLAEQLTISRYRQHGFDLTNITSGGDGFHDITPEFSQRRTDARRKWFSVPENRARMIKALNAGRDNPEHRKKLSAALAASWRDQSTKANYLAGMRDPDALLRRAAASKRRYDDPEFRRKHSETAAAIWSTPERRQEARERAIALHSDPEIVERRRASLRAANLRPDVKARNLEVLAAIRANPVSQKKRSDSLKANWADPDASAKRRASLSSDETRTKMSASAKARWKDPKKSTKVLASFASPESRAKRSDSAIRRSTPEYRAMMAAKTKANWASGSRKKHKRRSDATGEPTCL